MNQLHFTRHQKIRLLRHWGFVVTQVRCQFSQSIYHNDVEYFDKVKDGVFLNNEEYMRPTVGNGEFGDDTWIDLAFWEQLSLHIYEFFLRSKD